MNFARLFAKMKLSEKDAEVIFDRDEPIGAATDLVMPRRRWFGKRGRFAIATAVKNRRSLVSQNTTDFLS